MRIVNANDAVWRKLGIAALDIAPLLNVAVPNEPNNHVLSLWSTKVYKRELIQMKKQKQLDQGTGDWFQWRQQGVTASTVAAMVGVEKWGNTAKTIWTEKTGPITPSNENADMQRGKRLEAPARELYESLFGWSVDPLCVIHDDYDFVRASLDGLRADDQLVVEIKCPREANHQKAISIAAVTDAMERQRMFDYSFQSYRYQILFQLLITGAPACHFVSYNENANFGHNKLVVIELAAEPKEQQRLLQRVIEFWKFVETRTPPPPEWCENCALPPTELVGHNYATPRSVLDANVSSGVDEVTICPF
jgi:putative phage-type endonuclease